MDLDCEVDLNPREMRSIDKAPAKAAGCIGSYRYATGEHGQILLCKAIMLEDLPWDIETYANENADFPRTSTNNQLYSEFDFEAYRALGHATMTAMVSMLPKVDEDRARFEDSGRSDAPEDGELVAARSSSSNGHRAVAPSVPVPAMRKGEPDVLPGGHTPAS